MKNRKKNFADFVTSPSPQEFRGCFLKHLHKSRKRARKLKAGALNQFIKSLSLRLISTLYV